MNVTYLKNRLTTIISVRHLFDLGKLTMESIEMLAHERSGVWRGSSSHVGDLCSNLSYWHTRQVLTTKNTCSPQVSSCDRPSEDLATLNRDILAKFPSGCCYNMAGTIYVLW